MRFSIRNLMIATVFCALVVASVFYPIYAPLIPIFALALIVWRLFYPLVRHPEKRTVLRFACLGVVVTLLLAITGLYVTLFDEASETIGYMQLARIEAGYRKIPRDQMAEREEVAEAVPELVEFLRHREARVRTRAANMLGRLGAPAGAAVPTLIETLHDPNLSVRIESARALGRIGSAAKPALADLTSMMGEPLVRFAAAEAVWRLTRDAEAVIPTLAAVVRADNTTWSPEAVYLLYHIDENHPAVIPGLIFALKEGVPRRDATKAARLLGALGPRAESAVPALAQTLIYYREGSFYGDSYNGKAVRAAIREALQKIEGLPDESDSDLPKIVDQDSEVVVAYPNSVGFRTVARIAGYEWHGSPSISPDGKQLAWDAHRSGLTSPSVFVGDFDGSVVHKIDRATRPLWLEDTILLVHRGGNLVKLDLDSDLKQEVLFNADTASLSMNRRFLVFATGGETVVHDLDSGDRNVVHLEPKPRTFNGLAVSNDGKRVAYVGRVERGEGIYLAEVTDGIGKLVADEEGAEYYPQFSSDETRLLFTSGSLVLNAAAFTNRVYVVDLESGKSRAITGGLDHCRDGSWSSDEKTIVMVAVSLETVRKRLEADQHLDRAVALKEQGEFDRAVEECGAAILAYPTLTQAYLTMGKCLLELNKTDEAIYELRHAIRLDPGDVDAHRILASIYMGRQDWSETRKVYGQLAQGNPTNDRAWLDYVDVSWWHDSNSGRPPDAAMHAYRQASAALSEDKLLEVTVVHAAWCLWAGDREAYERLCRAAAAQYRESTVPRIQFLLSRMLAMSSEPVIETGSLVEIAQASVTGEAPSWWHKRALAICLLRDGQFDAAVETFDQDELGVALAYAAGGRRDLAKEALSGARQQFAEDPTNPRSSLHPHDRLTRQLYLKEVEQLLTSE